MVDSDGPPSDPAGGASELGEILDELQAQGYNSQFIVREDGVLCRNCDNVFDGSLLRDPIVRRLEGASDPADELLVVGATCPECETGGAMTVQYGPTAGVADEQILAAIDL